MKKKKKYFQWWTMSFGHSGPVMWTYTATISCHLQVWKQDNRTYLTTAVCNLLYDFRLSVNQEVSQIIWGHQSHFYSPVYMNYKRVMTCSCPVAEVLSTEWLKDTWNNAQGTVNSKGNGFDFDSVCHNVIINGLFIYQ